MNIVFENPNTLRNFENCFALTAGSNHSVFDVSPIFYHLINVDQEHKGKFIPLGIEKIKWIDHYIIPTHVGYHPKDWLAKRNNLIFDNLNPVYLNDLKSGKALLCIDQSLEGYQTLWMWDKMHLQCGNVCVPPSSLIFITGNALAPVQYDTWCNEYGICNKIKVIATEVLENNVNNPNLDINWDTNLNYKIDNINDIKTFNCLNKRSRIHRIWFYLYLYRSGLLDKGLVTMNPYSEVPPLDGHVIDYTLQQDGLSKLPLYILNLPNDEPDLANYHFYVSNIFSEIYQNSWVSIVPESTFTEEQLSVFITEKTFKSIASMHPFIILGGRGSLSRLRDLGYRTFSGFIDETYDTLYSVDRLDAIINEIKRIDAIEDKLSWFLSMKDILMHNYNLLISRNQKRPPAVRELLDYYNDYFRLADNK